jgi:hypothetical protein
MTDSTKTPEVNYTPEMVAQIVAAAPLNLEKAKVLAETLGKTYRSVIAKAKSENVEYVSKPAPTKKPKGETKSDIVSDICALVSLENLTGLEKAPASALRRLRSAIPILDDPASES